MVNSLASQLNKALDRLVEKTDQLQQAGHWDAEQEARLEAAFKRINEVATHLEQQQKLESRMAQKLEKTVSRLNKVLKKQDYAGGGTEREPGGNIERLARTVKVIGQISEIVAGSMQVIGKAYRENKAETPDPGNEDAKTDGVDLTGILTQLNGLVKTFVESNSSTKEDTAVSSSETITPAAEPAGDNQRNRVDQG